MGEKRGFELVTISVRKTEPTLRGSVGAVLKSQTRNGGVVTGTHGLKSWRMGCLRAVELRRIPSHCAERGKYPGFFPPSSLPSVPPIG